MKKMTVKKWIGFLSKLLVAAVVFAFMAMKSIDFFTFATPADQWYYAWLGFGLTGGGVIMYLVVFSWDADTSLRRTVSLIMLAVCIIGELLTAGFGLEIDTWRKIGYQMTADDFKVMIFAVQILGFAHAAALVAYTVGDKIVDALRDDDGDGIPNIIDKKDNRQQRPQQPANTQQPPANRPAFAANTEKAELADGENPNPRQ